MAHFVMSSLQDLLLIQIHDLLFCPVSTIVVLDVRKPNPGFALGFLGAFLAFVVVVSEGLSISTASFLVDESEETVAT